MNPLVEINESEEVAADVSSIFEHDDVSAGAAAFEEDAAENLYAPLF